MGKRTNYDLNKGRLSRIFFSLYEFNCVQAHYNTNLSTEIELWARIWKEDTEEYFSSSIHCLMNRGTKITHTTLKMLK